MKYKLSDVFELQMGKTPSRDNAAYWSQSEFPWVSISDLSGAGKYIHATKESLSKLAVEESGIKIIPAQTVIMSFKLSIGKVSITPVPMYSNEAIMAFIDRGIVEIKPEYLYYLLLHRDWDEGTNKAVMGKTLNKATLSDVVIDIHPIDEQEKIVAVLNKASEIIDSYQRQLRTLDTLIKARFVEMFGEITDYVNITEIAHTYIGLVTTMTTHYCDKGTPLLFNSSIKADRIVWDGTCLDSEFSELNKGRMHQTYDILTVHTGDIGTSAVIGEELNNSLGFATIVTRINERNKYNPRYISSFLNYGSGKEQLSKYSRDVRNNLNLKDFNRLMVPNASISAQNEYDEFVKQVDKSKVVVQKALDKAQLLFDSLMQRYFG